MKGEKGLSILLKTMKPKINIGEYVFFTITNSTEVDNDVLP